MTPELRGAIEHHLEQVEQILDAAFELQDREEAREHLDEVRELLSHRRAHA